MSGAAVLSTSGLSKSFGANIAVRDVSLEVRENSLHCIIGPNGAGKTTLFNLLTRDLRPSAGRIHFAGEDVTSRRPDEISRRGIGRSYQITSVFGSMTVRDNVWVAAYRFLRQGALTFWRRDRAGSEVDRWVEETLARVGLREAADLRADELSYGDQRVLEIAIALATRPRLILLDEPMSGLSQEDTRRMAALVRSLTERGTVLMIEHKIDVIMGISDRVTVMNFGEVIADGPPERIAADPLVRQAYFGS
jgi:branched-chain amino acid transport system ATP-binding protein